MTATATATAAAVPAARPYDPVDLSSQAFWAQPAVTREATFAELRAHRPVSWHRPVEEKLFSDPNDQGFWASPGTPTWWR